MYVTTRLRPIVQILIALAVALLYATWPWVSSSEEIEKEFLIKANLEKKYKDAIVYVSTEAIDNQDTSTIHTGSGFIISKEGHVITANHVLPLQGPRTYKQATTIVRIGSVKNENLEAKVVGRNIKHDLALIKMHAPPSYMRTVDIGNPTIVKRNIDYLYLAGFPAGEDLFITRGELQSLSSQKEKDRWLAKIDVISGDSGGPVFFKGKVVGVAQSGYEVAEKNKVVAPLILADTFLEEAGLWKPWEGTEAVREKFESRDKTVTASLRTTNDSRKRTVKTKELFKLRERKNNMDDAIRKYRYRLFGIASTLEEMQRYFKTQELDEAIDSLNQGDVEPAAKLLEDVAFSNGREADEANYQLGSIAELTVDYDRAFSLYKQALSGLNPKAIYYASAADIAHKLGDTESAVKWASEAVEILETEVGKKDPRFAIALCRLGELVVDFNSNQTIQNCREAISILSDYPGRELEIAEARDTLGVAHEFNSDYLEAEEQYRKALSTSARIGELVEGIQPQKILGTVNNNLAGLYRTMGRHKDSKSPSMKAISINERVLGKDHPKLGIYLAGLAILKRALAEYGESEKLFRKARRLLTSALGHNNRLVGSILYHIAPLALIQNKDDQAFNVAEKSLKILETVYGKKESIHEMRTRMILAEIKSIQGQHIEAQEDLDQAEKINLAKYRGSINNLRIMLIRAAIKIRQSKYDEARSFANKATEFSKDVYYRYDPLLGELNLLWGKIHSGLMQWEDAETRLEKAQQIFFDSLGPKHPKRATALRELAQVQTKLGKRNESAGTQAQASRIFSDHAKVRVVTVIDL